MHTDDRLCYCVNCKCLTIDDCLSHDCNCCTYVNQKGDDVHFEGITGETLFERELKEGN